VEATIRQATEADHGALLALWDEFAGDSFPPWVNRPREGTSMGIAESIRLGTVFVAERDEGLLGFAAALPRGPAAAELIELYVAPAERGGGVARALVREVVAAAKRLGAEFVLVATAADNDAARSVYERWGFRPAQVELLAPLAELESRLGGREPGVSFGSIHVQTDDVADVERAVRQFVPRLPGRSRGSAIAPPRNGWTAVYDDVCDRDPAQLRRFARELSDALGAVVLALGVEQGAVARFLLLDRGRIMDEYLSVQEYYGPLPPGDVIALGANPRLVARLTGADPERVRAAAKHAPTPEGLPPAPELLREIALAIGIEGGDHGFEAARAIPGAVVWET